MNRTSPHTARGSAASSRASSRRSPSLRAAVALVLFACGLAAAAVQEPRPKPPEEGGTITGTIYGPNDRGVAQALVQVTGNGVSTAVVASENGSFEVHVPKLGAYRLKIVANGYRTAFSSASVDQPLQVVPVTVRLTPVQLIVQVFAS